MDYHQHQQQARPAGPGRELTPEESLCWMMHAGIFGCVIYTMCSEDAEIVREFDQRDEGRLQLDVPPPSPVQQQQQPQPQPQPRKHSSHHGHRGQAHSSSSQAPSVASDRRSSSSRASSSSKDQSPEAKEARRQRRLEQRRQREQLARMLQTPPEQLEPTVEAHPSIHNTGADDAETLVTTTTNGPLGQLRGANSPLEVCLLPAGRNAIIVAAHRGDEPCLYALAPTIRGEVLLHAFEPVEMARCAMGFYDLCVRIPWIRHVMQMNALYLPPGSVVAAREFHGSAGGIPLGMLAQVLESASNHACLALRVPQQRFRCAAFRSAEELPLLVLYPVYMETSAYVLAEAFKHLTHSMDVKNQQVCVRIQQRLMNIQSRDLLTALWHFVGPVVGGPGVRGPEDAGPFLIEAMRYAKDAEQRAIDLIELWQEQNVRVRAFSPRRAVVHAPPPSPSSAAAPPSAGVPQPRPWGT